jgi:hypothetical protein
MRANIVGRQRFNIVQRPLRRQTPGRIVTAAAQFEKNLLPRFILQRPQRLHDAGACRLELSVGNALCGVPPSAHSARNLGSRNGAEPVPYRTGRIPAFVPLLARPTFDAVPLLARPTFDSAIRFGTASAGQAVPIIRRQHRILQRR